MLSRTLPVTRMAALRMLPRMSLQSRSFWDSTERKDVMRVDPIKPPMNTVIVFVPQQKAYIIERFGKFNKTLSPGIHFLFPLIDRIAYVQSLKEEAFSVLKQTAITKDNVTISIDGVLYLRIFDPYAASYGVENAIEAMMQLAQTSMRSELGKITLDKTFEERVSLNENINTAINKAGKSWGIECMRYEIKDILPPASVQKAMNMQAESERRKRAMILDSEGLRASEINKAEGVKRAAVLEAEAEAETILKKATATAEGIRLVSESINKEGGSNAVSLRIAEQYVEAFGNIAKKGNTILLPANLGDPAAMVAQAMAVYGKITASGKEEESRDVKQVEKEETPVEFKLK